MSDLEKNFQYFLTHKDDLVESFKGRYLVIVGQKVVGDYGSKAEAIIAAQQEYSLGSFLVQYCDNVEEVYTQTFHSRVAFP